MEVHSSSSLSPPATKALRRGRREKPWPAAKQRKLLRLYVCTQSERLPLVRILELLRDGDFDPRQRNSHKHLKNMLPDRRIDDWRPRDLATMLIRVRFLRSVRAERRIRRNRRRGACDQPNTPPILSLTSHDEYLGALAPIGQHPILSSSRGRTPMVKSESDRSTPPTAGAESTATPGSYPRDRSPSVSSKSPSTGSDKSNSKRRSWASVLSSISSGINSLARSSSTTSSRGINETGATIAISKLSREDFLSLLEEKPEARPATAKGAKGGKQSKGSKVPTLKNPTTLFRRNPYSSENPTTEALNSALVGMCCAAYVGTSTQGCVHERLSRAISAQRSEGPAFCQFTVTDEEANAVDKYGNTLLHVAARWGARVSLLILILRHTLDISMVNHRGETFLHVYDPPTHPRLRPASFLNLIRCLRSKGFDFCQRDVDKQTFLHLLVPKKAFPVELMHCLFREVGHGTSRFLVASKSFHDERLWHCVRKNLNQHAPKLHRVFGDEIELARRYLPEFSDSRSSSRNAFTPDMGRMSWESNSYRSQQQEKRQSMTSSVGSQYPTAKRTPLMNLLRRIAAGRESTDKDMEARIEKALGINTPGGGKLSNAELGVLLNERDTEGNAALHYAAEFGIVAAVKYLCAHAAQVNCFNNCGNTPLQLVKYAIQRTDVMSDVHMEARYLRCAVLLLERGAIDQSKLVSEKSMIFPYDVFDGSERCIANLINQGVANQCKGLHLLSNSTVDHHHHYHHHHPDQHYGQMMSPGLMGPHHGGPPPVVMDQGMSLEFETSYML
ncbi:hypothetical protein V8F33_009212 [Rhypophila sp. PSN 637]